jgi:DNA replication licensing factor MCM7
MYDEAAKSIAPEIYGMLDMKKALLLALVGSFTKTMKDGMKIRGDIHTLFMGDPGVAKSQLLKQVVNIAPRSVYTTGKGSSGVGLTAAVIRDKNTGEVTLEGGALVLADMGICCIDEFDKMEEGDRTAIHEVMEQQSVSVAKSGITTTLNCRTTIIAAANPVYGRYNPFKSPVENIDLPAALLSRFDLLFLLLDTVDPEKDKMLSQHVAKVHSTYEMQKTEGEDKVGSSGNPGDDDGDVLNLGFKPFDASFMRAYIRKAKTLEPLVTDELMRDIADAYVQMREDEKRSDIDSRKSYTTPRTLLAILRLSQAHARVRFSKHVERQDFDEALRLMKASKESVELSAPAKRGVNPVDLVYDIIADLSRRADEGGWVDIAHVVSMAGHKALDREMVAEAIENWESINILCQNENKTKVKFMVPPA